MKRPTSGLVLSARIGYPRLSQSQNVNGLAGGAYCDDGID